MTIDRFGKNIRMGWKRHEEIWLEAAMQLDVKEREAAFRDIAELTKRPYSTVRSKAYDHLADLLDARAVLRDLARKRAGRADPVLAPSCISPPSRARLMGGRA